MFTRMLLHMIKTTFPVQYSVNSHSRFQRSISNVQNLSIPSLYIQDIDLPQGAPVSRLSTAFRIKSGIGKDDFVPLFPFLTTYDLRVKLPGIFISVKQFIHFFHRIRPPACIFICIMLPYAAAGYRL